MFGAIPASMLVDLAKQQGAYFQMDLDLECPPWVFVDPKFLTSEQTGYSVITSNGQRWGLIGSEDHPRFRDTRQWLEREGYIVCAHNCSNGDRVLKPFYFNNVLLEEGEQFSCAPAMAYGYSKTYNGGNPLITFEEEPEEEPITLDYSNQLDWVFQEEMMDGI